MWGAKLSIKNMFSPQQCNVIIHFFVFFPHAHLHFMCDWLALGENVAQILCSKDISGLRDNNQFLSLSVVLSLSVYLSLSCICLCRVFIFVAQIFCSKDISGQRDCDQFFVILTFDVLELYSWCTMQCVAVRAHNLWNFGCRGIAINGIW